MNRSLGFTIIELLIVIAIISVLSVVGIGSYMSSQTKTRDTLRKQELNNLAKALNLYYADSGVFPESAIVQAAIGNKGKLSIGDKLYLKEVGGEPVKGKPQYCYVSDGKKYKIYSILENSEDSEYRKLSANKSIGYTDSCTGLDPQNVTLNPSYDYQVFSPNVGVIW